jgi:hypothetical protein
MFHSIQFGFGAHQSTVQWLSRAFSVGEGKQLGRESDKSSLCSAEVKNGGSDESSPCSAEVKNGGAVPPLPHMSSWHSA